MQISENEQLIAKVENLEYEEFLGSAPRFLAERTMVVAVPPAQSARDAERVENSLLAEEGMRDGHRRRASRYIPCVV
jgi:hypothetical protein